MTIKFILVLYILSLNQAPAVTSIGPYDDKKSCDIAAQVAAQDGWKVKCYPIGKLELKAQAPASAPAPSSEAPAATPEAKGGKQKQ